MIVDWKINKSNGKVHLTMISKRYILIDVPSLIHSASNHNEHKLQHV